MEAQKRPFSVMADQLLPPTQFKPGFAEDQPEKLNAIVNNRGKMMIAKSVISPGNKNVRP
jgi:hypothetical protein